MYAVKELIPTIYEHEILFSKTILLGYYNNPILLLKSVIRKDPLIEAFIENLFNKLKADGKKVLRSEIDQRVNDKNIMYLRFDKQEAFNGSLKFGQSDSIHIKIRLKGNLKDSTIIELVQDILE